jgi:cytochrome c biogenesis protein CcmG/thiol:disulfide interchange protein DsbE
MQKLPVVVIAILFVLGCGSGTGASENQAAAENQDPKATVESSPVDAPAEEPAAAPAGKVEMVKATPSDEAAAPDEFDQAEARRATEVVSKPAVDTSQLKAAPSWVMRNLDGVVVSSDAYAGKVVLVDFWATWCGPCKKSIPHLIDLHDEYKDKGFAVIGVSMDQAGPRKVIPFVAQYQINYPVLMVTQQVWNDFGGIRGVPTAFIISQDGKIYQKLVGLRPKEAYERPIKALLGIS